MSQNLAQSGGVFLFDNFVDITLDNVAITKNNAKIGGGVMRVI